MEREQVRTTRRGAVEHCLHVLQRQRPADTVEELVEHAPPTGLRRQRGGEVEIAAVAGQLACEDIVQRDADLVGRSRWARRRHRELRLVRKLPSISRAPGMAARIPSGVVSFEPPVPMLSQLASRVPTGAQWLYEPKFDGFRGLLRRSDSGLVRLTSRQGKDLTDWFPELAQAGLHHSAGRRYRCPTGSERGHGPGPVAVPGVPWDG